MNIFTISIIIFIVYAPVSVIFRNIANRKINGKNVIWSISNNKEMMSQLKTKSRKLYYLMKLEYLVCLQLIIIAFFY